MSLPMADPCCATFETVHPPDVQTNSACAKPTRRRALGALRCQKPERLAIVIAGARQNVRRQMRRRWFLVPVQRFQVIAHELLVETRRAGAGVVRGPRAQ